MRLCLHQAYLAPSFCLVSRQANIRHSAIHCTRCITDHQIHFYTLPTLDMVPFNILKPIRNVITFAVDEQHIRRPPPPTASDIVVPIEPLPVDFCVIKRNAIVLFSLRERLFFHKVHILSLTIVQAQLTLG